MPAANSALRENSARRYSCEKGGVVIVLEASFPRAQSPHAVLAPVVITRHLKFVEGKLWHTVERTGAI